MRTRNARRRSVAGFTLVELLASLAIAAIILAALSGVVHTALAARDDGDLRNTLAEDAGFAMERLVRAVSRSPRLLIPMVDKTSIRQHAFDELCRQIRESEAPKPSARISTLKEAERSAIAQQRQISPGGSR